MMLLRLCTFVYTTCNDLQKICTIDTNLTIIYILWIGETNIRIDGSVLWTTLKPLTNVVGQAVPHESYKRKCPCGTNRLDYPKQPGLPKRVQRLKGPNPSVPAV